MAARLSLGTVLEAAGRYEEARGVYEECIKKESAHLGACNQLCRLLLMEVSGVLAGRFDVPDRRRSLAFEEAKNVCPQAVAVAPDDVTANMHLGMLYKEGLEFDQASVYLRRAVQGAPEDVTSLTNLAAVLSRNAQFPEAVDITRRIIQLGKRKPTE